MSLQKSPRRTLLSTERTNPMADAPEPTAEEAAVIYGFGKGLRGMDAEEPEAREEAARDGWP